MATPPLNILVTNDDGITAPGIRNLIQAVHPLGKLTVVAPDSPQSGMGHAITTNRPLRLNPVDLSDLGADITAYACNGTPVDCVKLATGVLMDQKPDLLVSGINHGANASMSIFYSGTMSAAMEGVFEGILSIGFSLCNFSIEADFSAAQVVARQVVQQALEKPYPTSTVLNVNIPDVPLEMLRGMRMTRQCIGRWVEQFETRKDPYGHEYYWLVGNFHTDDAAEDTDIWALRNNYVSISPARSDLTDYETLEKLTTWSGEILSNTKTESRN